MRNSHKSLVHLVQNADILGLLCRSRTLQANPAARLASIGFMLVEEDARTHACLSAATADGSSGFRQYETGYRRDERKKQKNMFLYCSGRRYKRVCTAVEDGTKGFVLQWKPVQNPD